MVAEAHGGSAEVIYAALQQRILNGEIPQGDRLVVRAYAQEFGTSDLPVREAIRKLEADGLVESHRNRGARVRKLSPQEIPGTYIVRGELEGLATRLAGPYLTDDDLDDLNQLNDEMKTTASKGEPADYYRLNHRFHKLIFSRCPFPEVTDTINRIWDGQTAFGVVFSMDVHRMEISIAEHDAIINDLVAQEWDSAGNRARDHKTSVARSLLRSMDMELPRELRT